MTGDGATTNEGAVFDLRYQRYTEVRLGRRGAVRAAFYDGIKNVLGIGRRFRRKLFPAILIGIAIVPAIVVVGLRVIFNDLDVDIIDHGDYFGLTATMSFIFVALAVPQLLVPDRVQGVLSVYASRPLLITDYLWARVGALAAVTFGFLILPHLVLFIGQGVVSGDFLDHISDNWKLIWQVPLVSAGYFAVQAGVAFAVAAYARNVGVAAGIYLGIMFVSTAVGNGLTEAGFELGALLSLLDIPAEVNAWVFDIQNSDTAFERADLEPWTALAMIVLLSVVTAVIVVRRYRRLA